MSEQACHLNAVYFGRFLKWAIEEAEKEVENNFRLARSIKDDSLDTYWAWISRYSSSDLNSILRAGLRCKYKQGATWLGRPCTTAEVDLWKTFAFGHVDYLRRVITSTPPVDDPKARIDKRALRKNVKAGIKDVLGKPHYSGGAVWRYQNEYRGWIIETEIDTGGNILHRQIEYEHIIKNKSNVVLHRQISFLEWTLRHGLTKWNRLHEEDVPEMVESLRGFCKTFLDVAPSFLEGLDPNDLTLPPSQKRESQGRAFEGR